MKQSPSHVHILPVPQHYGWGEKGSNSFGGALWKKCQTLYNSGNGQDMEPFSEEESYAEIWYGCHKNGMSRVISESNSTPSQSLEEFIMSSDVYKPKDDSVEPLPYLLKVLSINKALSIQCHPDKETAERLHRENKFVYKDANHKPEVALALEGGLKALCGFRPWEQIAEGLMHVPSFSSLIGESWMASNKLRLMNPKVNTEEQTQLIKSFFTKLMEADAAHVKEALTLLVQSSKTILSNMELPSHIHKSVEIVALLSEDYPGDIGCFAPFYLNYVQLEMGQCIFIKPNTLHCYLRGHIVECMACSDNVIRCGLTPKERDLNLLLEIADFHGSADFYLKPLTSFLHKDNDKTISLYDPKLKDFRLYLIEISQPTGCSSAIKIDGFCPAILLVLKGESQIILSSPEGRQEIIPLVSEGNSIIIPSGFSIEAAIKPHINKPPHASQLELEDVERNFVQSVQAEKFLAVVALGGMYYLSLSMRKKGFFKNEFCPRFAKNSLNCTCPCDLCVLARQESCLNSSPCFCEFVTRKTDRTDHLQNLLSGGEISISGSIGLLPETPNLINFQPGGSPQQPPYPTQQPPFLTQQPPFPTQQPSYPSQQPPSPLEIPRREERRLSGPAGEGVACCCQCSNCGGCYFSQEPKTVNYEGKTRDFHGYSRLTEDPFSFTVTSVFPKTTF